MTSDLGVEHVVERQFLFHCSCGSTIETSGKREICPDCGKTVEVVRCVPTPKGNKYTLRISKQEHGRNAEPLLLGAAAMQPARPHHEGPDHERLFRRTASTRLQRYHLQSPDYNKRYLHLGLLILLAPLYLPLLLAFLGLFLVPGPVGQDRSDPNIIEMPKPDDCGLFSGCHYEKRVIHVNDKRGAHTIIMWQRMEN